MQAKVLIIMGSHRNDKNSGYLVSSLMAKLSNIQVDVDVVDVNKLNIKHCLDCSYCKKEYGKCILKDDMNVVYTLMKEARFVVIVSPVYFNNVTSKLKALIDRCQMIFMCDFIHKNPFVDDIDKEHKFGYILSSGGAKAYENQFLGSELTIQLLYSILKVTLKEHFKYSNTDRVKLEERKQIVDNDINKILNQIYNEVV